MTQMKAGPVNVQALLKLGGQVVPVADRGLGGVLDVMGQGDVGEILAALHLAGDDFAGGGCGGGCAVGSGAGALDAGVHIGAVVVTDVHDVMAPLEGAGQRLQADVVRAAVPAERHEFQFAVRGNLALLLQRLVHRLDAADRRRGVFERAVDERLQPGGVRVDRGGDLEAARGAGDHDVVIRHLVQQLGNDGNAASGAQPVTRREAIGSLGEFF